MANWVIKEPSQGNVELWCERKRMGTHEDVRRARRAAELRMGESDVLYHEEPDGYRVRLKGKRQGWRAR